MVGVRMGRCRPSSIQRSVRTASLPLSFLRPTLQLMTGTRFTSLSVWPSSTNLTSFASHHRTTAEKKATEREHVSQTRATEKGYALC